MDGMLIIQRSSFTNDDAFNKEIKLKIKDLFELRLRKLGITQEDMNDIEAVNNYKIGRDDVEEPGKYLTQTYRARGIALLEAVSDDEKTIIYVPQRNPDYTTTLDWISTFTPHTGNFPNT